MRYGILLGATLALGASPALPDAITCGPADPAEAVMPQEEIAKKCPPGYRPCGTGCCPA